MDTEVGLPYGTQIFGEQEQKVDKSSRCWELTMGMDMDVAEGAFSHSHVVIIFGWMALAHMVSYYLSSAAWLIWFLFLVLATSMSYPKP